MNKVTKTQMIVIFGMLLAIMLPIIMTVSSPLTYKHADELVNIPIGRYFLTYSMYAGMYWAFATIGLFVCAPILYMIGKVDSIVRLKLKKAQSSA